MNPLYQQFGTPQMQQPMMPNNPFACVMMAMRNPQAFVRQAFPDIPGEISNDPNAILNYLRNTRGITDEQIQQLRSQYRF